MVTKKEEEKKNNNKQERRRKRYRNKRAYSYKEKSEANNPTLPIPSNNSARTQSVTSLCRIEPPLPLFRILYVMCVCVSDASHSRITFVKKINSSSVAKKSLYKIQWNMRRCGCSLIHLDCLHKIEICNCWATASGSHSSAYPFNSNEYRINFVSEFERLVLEVAKPCHVSSIYTYLSVFFVSVLFYYLVKRFWSVAKRMRPKSV